GRSSQTKATKMKTRKRTGEDMQIQTGKLQKCMGSCVFCLMLVFCWDVARAAETNFLTAVNQGDVGSVKLLLMSKADIEQTGAKGRTPLMIAVLAENGELVKLL